MRNVTFFSIVYTTLVLLFGIMSYWYGNNIFSLFFEISAGILLLGSLYFLAKKKKFIHIVIGSLSLILMLYFWYFFYTTTAFFPGIMGAVSAFITYTHGKEAFKVYSKS